MYFNNWDFAIGYTGLIYVDIYDMNIYLTICSQLIAISAAGNLPSAGFSWKKQYLYVHGNMGFGEVISWDIPLCFPILPSFTFKSGILPFMGYTHSMVFHNYAPMICSLVMVGYGGVIFHHPNMTMVSAIKKLPSRDSFG